MEKLWIVLKKEIKVFLKTNYQFVHLQEKWFPKAPIALVSWELLCGFFFPGKEVQ